MSQQLFHAMVSILAVLAFSTLVTQAASDPHPMVGNWEGTYINSRGLTGTARVQVIARGGDSYVAVVSVDDGPRMEIPGKLDGAKVVFEGDGDQGPEAGGPAQIKVQPFSETQLIGSIRDVRRVKSLDLKKVNTESPTLGAQPPQGATVLFGGKGLEQWQSQDGTPASWKITGSGAMEVTEKNIVSKEEFSDARIHVEFRTPFMPEATGQQRGNSGVYVQGRYEVQVLDSFGLERKDNECGGIYQVAAPRLNACLAPLQWQTYDITFRAPQFDPSGNKTKNAVITVEHNGILIHDQVEIPAPTRGGVGEDEVSRGGVLLQDHGNPVQFRNIWIVPQ